MNKLVKDALVLTIITLVAGACLGVVYVVTKEPIAVAQQAAVDAAYKSLFPDAGSFEDAADFDSEAATATADDAVTGAGIVGYEVGKKGNTISSCSIAKDASGNDLGYVITVTNHKGYGGDVTVSVGITNDGNVNGYSITEINETPGLGMKATEDKFKSQFDNVTAELKTVVKMPPGDNEIEAISGATITSRAVTNAVDAAIAYFNSIGGGAS